MLEQSRELIEKAERFAAMDDATLAQHQVRTLLSDLAQALREATKPPVMPGIDERVEDWGQ